MVAAVWQQFVGIVVAKEGDARCRFSYYCCAVYTRHSIVYGMIG